MNRPGILGVALAAGAFLLVGAASAASGSLEAASPPLETQAKRLSGRADVRITRPVRGSFDPMEPFEDFEDSSQGDVFWVEKATGRVRRYFNPKSLQNNGVRVGQSLIEQRADLKLNEVYDATRIGRLRRETRELRGENHKGYTVRYTEFVGDVETFNYADMTFAPDGELVDLLIQDYPVTVSLEASIGRNQAIQTAARALKMERRSSEEAHLIVTRDPTTGAQRLCWAVDLSTGDAEFGSKGFSAVDATDGTVVDLAVAD